MGNRRGAVPSRGAIFPNPSGPRGRWRPVRGAVGFAARTRSRTDQPGRRGDCRVSPRRPAAEPGWAGEFPPPAVLRRPRGGIWLASEASRRRRQKASSWGCDNFVNHSGGGQSQFCSTVLRQRQIEQSGTGDSPPTPRLSKGRANGEGLVCHAASARRRRRYVFCTK